ncbi:MAG: hypothetical protein IJM15_04045 [Erysipelotrichaceae bacterium]|nr:hypothetical protein [Erysipelotrichaceae bacterium]
MNDGIVKVKNASYARYEELLIRRDVIAKEGFRYQLEYLREFGELMSESFEAKIKCIEKKKIIAWCQRRINRGQKIDGNLLDSYINNVMADYYDRLKEMLERNDRLNKGTPISEYTFRKIKNVYYKIAKLIHPDMNPDLKDDERISDLWNRTVVAYECNQLKELEDLLVLVNGYLESINYSHEDIEIPDINEKIFELNQKIDEMIKSDPYQFKYLLADKEAVEEKKEDLRKEIADYRKYAEELDEVIASFTIERMVS